MNIYLTGGTGFIGSHVVKELVSKGHSVHVLARDVKKAPGIASLPRVKMIKCDLTKPGAVKAVTKPYALIHVALCWGDTGPDMIKNETHLSVSLIDRAIKKGAKKIIYTSSTAAVGPLPADVTEASLGKPADFYGATKGSVELFLSAYSSYYPKLELNVIRPGYTFGNPAAGGAPIEPDRRFVNICRNALAGKPIEVIKHDGTQFIHGSQLAEIYSAVVEGSFKNEIFFGLGAEFTTWEEIARYAVKKAGSKSKITVKNLGWSDNPRIYKVDKIKRYFGFSFKSGRTLRSHVDYLLTNP